MATVPLHSPNVLRIVRLAAIFPLVAFPSVTLAEAPPAAAPSTVPTPIAVTWENAPATRRSGLAVGLLPSFGFGAIRGYPNDSKKIGYPQYRSASGTRVFAGSGLWIGGAITDYFNFGLGIVNSRYLGDGTPTSTAFIFHMDGFPLFPWGGHLRDLGVSFDVGTGAVQLTATTDATTKIVDSGASSYIALGGFYEAFRVWRVAMGPYVLGSYAYSQSASAPSFGAGFRAVLYLRP